MRHKNSAGVDLYTLVSAGFFWFKLLVAVDFVYLRKCLVRSVDLFYTNVNE